MWFFAADCDWACLSMRKPLGLLMLERPPHVSGKTAERQPNWGLVMTPTSELHVQDAAHL